MYPQFQDSYGGPQPVQQQPMNFNIDALRQLLMQRFGGGRRFGYTPPGPPQGYGGGRRAEDVTPPGPPQGGDPGAPWFRGDPFQNRPGGGTQRPEGITPPGPHQGPQGVPAPWRGDSFQNRPDPRPPAQPEVPNNFGTGGMTWAQQAAMGGPAGPEPMPGNWGGGVKTPPPMSTPDSRYPTADTGGPNIQTLGNYMALARPVFQPPAPEAPQLDRRYNPFLY